MNVIAINGSPRKNWNTDTLLKKVLEGAESAGAETEMVYLYDLKFCGCKSCMACKLKKEPRPNRCVLRDELTPVLDKVHAADAVVLGSPIYFSEVTGEMRSFVERFLFQRTICFPPARLARITSTVRRARAGSACRSIMTTEAFRAAT